MHTQLSLVYFPAALLLGALHALEPGHAKVLTASYLIGIKGTKRDSIILGLSVALTHSAVVVLISVIGLWVGNEAFAGSATAWLERASGLIAILIGTWMLWRRTSRRFRHSPEHHEHAHEAVSIVCGPVRGSLEIAPTPLGERFRFQSEGVSSEVELSVEIFRGDRTESIRLTRSPDDAKIFLSAVEPEEPHAFRAVFCSSAGAVCEFEMHEPEDASDHSHEHLDDMTHARAHAANLPDYAKKGQRPTTKQIIAFGAAGGMIPCPASITVMLLALAAGKTSLGLFTVMGFSIGLAFTLVGIGIVVVSGLTHLQSSGKYTWVTKNAPVVSAGLVILSGFFALFVSH